MEHLEQGLASGIRPWLRKPRCGPDMPSIALQWPAPACCCGCIGAAGTLLGHVCDMCQMAGPPQTERPRGTRWVLWPTNSGFSGPSLGGPHMYGTPGATWSLRSAQALGEGTPVTTYSLLLKQVLVQPCLLCARVPPR